MIADTPPRVEIETRILEFVPDAMTDRFQDNRFSAFDAAVTIVRKPIDMADSRMIIYLPQPTDPKSTWRRVGSTLIFRVAPEMLAPGTLIFEGAIQDLRVKENLEARDGGTGNE
jgi:hypothetical protein